MKRFFQPVSSSGGGDPARKKSATTPSQEKNAETPVHVKPFTKTFGQTVPPNQPMGAVPASHRGPQKIVSWNCNGLSSRCKSDDDREAFLQFVTEHKPDCIALQEVRISASASPGCKPNDGRERDRSKFRENDKASRTDADVVNRVLRSPPFNDYRRYWSLSDTKYSGVGVLLRKDIVPNTVSYCIEGATETISTTTTAASCSSASGTASAAGGGGFLSGFGGKKKPKHHNEGRVLFMTFDDFDLLTTYTPCNGKASFERRQLWDRELAEFVSHYSDVQPPSSPLVSAPPPAAGKRPLVYVGDLNVAPYDNDLTHPSWFRSQFTDDVDALNQGQPGCTEGERQRFLRMLKAGNLVDTYRHLNPDSCASQNCDGAVVTWRGSAPTGTFPAKYFGKGMRIDFALLSQAVIGLWLRSSAIMGQRPERVGFLGSDHCPIMIQLSSDRGATTSSVSESASAHEQDDGGGAALSTQSQGQGQGECESGLTAVTQSGPAAATSCMVSAAKAPPPPPPPLPQGRSVFEDRIDHIDDD